MSDPRFDTEDFRIPVTVLTGFLGSGKTTLLNYWVKQPELANCAVLINEFGAVGLDHHLVEKLDDNVVMLESGCVCCTVQGDLVNALRELFMRAMRREIKPFQRVLIETTGLADPGPVLYTLRNDPFFAQRYRFDGTVTVVDVCHITQQLNQQYEAVKQVALADLLVLSKSDLADFGTLPEVEALLQRINPMAPRYVAVKGQLSPKVLEQNGPFGSGSQRSTQEIRQWLQGAIAELGLASPIKPIEESAYPLMGTRLIANAHSDVQAFCLRYTKPIPTARFLDGLRRVQMRYPERLLRFKAILWLEEQEQPVVVHGVHDQLYPIMNLPEWPSGEPASELVFIMKQTDRQEVEEMLQEEFFPKYPPFKYE
ncbi:CobW family GTP-binding protein [Tolumonas lignilytica]|uniref:CobW family GTP-binding protein n=1 Tax=Tolumonas lignilytica TaxID=1283284 RepID=UPI0004639795|nr:GTP-binding protein [Tolumonas lignilytica]